MLDWGKSRKEVIRPDFNRSIMIDFQGAKITSDVGFLLLREINDRFKIIVRRWYAHAASAFPLAHHYRSVLARGP